jgi:hypothetical protein
MKRTIKLSFIILALASVVFACSSQGPETVEDYDLVVTTPDRNFDFAEVLYYIMPDTVVLINDSLDSGSDGDVRDPHRFDDEILAAVARNMEQIGYERIEEDDGIEPDILVTISSLRTVYVGVYWWNYWWNYWNWWGYWGPGWNPWYPWGGGVYTWTTGTVIIDMLEPVSNPVYPNIPVVWNAMFNGLVSGSDESILRRIETSIDQAFRQSDYLGNIVPTPL